MREGGVEPPRPLGHTDLNRARLPIPPLAQVTRSPPSRRRAKSNADYRTQTLSGLSNRGAGVFRHLTHIVTSQIPRLRAGHSSGRVGAGRVGTGRVGAGRVGWRLPDSASSTAVRWRFNLHLTAASTSPSGNPHPTRARSRGSAPRGGAAAHILAFLPFLFPIPIPTVRLLRSDVRREEAIWCGKRAEVAILRTNRRQKCTKLPSRTTGCTRLPPRAARRTKPPPRRAERPTEKSATRPGHSPHLIRPASAPRPLFRASNGSSTRCRSRSARTVRPRGSGLDAPLTVYSG